MLKYFNRNYEILIALAIFIVILITKYEFFKAVILMLELTVIIEIVKMISDFIEKRRVRLRYIIDIFIIFLIRDVVILAAHHDKPYEDILFLLFVIFVFFIFRILALVFSPTAKKESVEWS